MVQEKDLKKGSQPRLLAVDNEVVVPVNKIVRMQVIGADVIHAWAMPSFGVKIDAVPGGLRDLVQGRARRGRLRPMLGIVRQGSRLHADRGAGGEGSRRQCPGSSRPRRNSPATTAIGLPAAKGDTAANSRRLNRPPTRH